jgi:hypothetical protein
MKLTHRQQVAARQSSNVDWTGIYNGFAYWNGKIYVWPGGGGFIYGPQPPFPTDTLKAYALNARGSSARLVANGQTDGTGVGYQGANLMISANGNDSSTGIVWAYVPALNTLELQPGYLHAYSASDFSGGMFQELWNNNIPDSPDQGCEFAKFTQPVVANGKVFLPTFCGKVIVYGLTSNPALTHGAAKRRPH